MRSWSFWMSLALVGITRTLRAELASVWPEAEIRVQLQHLANTGRVLYVAAHPDDENTQLIAYFARGRGYQTAYLSLTRGDGGQNVLGPEFGEKLGLARTEELLAARRIDGGRQFFSRAIDFGFSKDYQETLRIWDREQVLADVVRVIRVFQPDIIITRFPTTPGGTHGHHTASAVLALEAFKRAADPRAFPEQLHDLKPWQVRRILWNAYNFPNSPEVPGLKVDMSGQDPVRGVSFGELAVQSRAQHKTQGFGNFTGFGRTPRPETFQVLAGDPASHDPFDDIDTTWNRFPGAEGLSDEIEKVSRTFDPKFPESTVSALIAIRDRIDGLPAEPRVQEKHAWIDQIIASCLGLEAHTAIPHAEVVSGEKLLLQQHVTESASVPLQWIEVRYPTINQTEKIARPLKPGEPAAQATKITLPADLPLTQPYWLQSDPAVGLFSVATPALIGRPESPPVWPVEYVFEVGGKTFIVRDEPTEDGPAETPRILRERLTVIPPVSLKFTGPVEIFAPGAQRKIAIELTAARPNTHGDVTLQLPDGWKATPRRVKFHLTTAGEKGQVDFVVTAPAASQVVSLGATADVHGKPYDTQRVDVAYGHIPPQVLQPPARLKAVALEVAVHAKRVGYLPGAGDNVADALQQIGCEVVPLTGADLTVEHLGNLDAVVVGVRALNVRSDLAANWPQLFAYAEHGGNVILQYNNPNGLKVEKIAPYGLRLSADRVTDETAAMTLLAPDHPALNVPNKIGPADFDGWVQERGLYFPNHWDEAFTPLLECHDPNETPTRGALLVANYGRGHFVYTGLAFFRQLPAGVPGAYRLMANLVSLGK